MDVKVIGVIIEKIGTVLANKAYEEQERELNENVKSMAKDMVQDMVDKSIFEELHKRQRQPK